MPYIEPPEIEIDNGEDQEDQKNWMDEFEFSLDMHEAYEERYL
jgi:hypothetical protein